MESEGAEGFTIDKTECTDVGTDIIIYLRDDTEDDKYSEFLDEFRIKSIIKQYSDYIRYPIVMNVTKQRQKPASEEEMNLRIISLSTRLILRTKSSTAWCLYGR